MSIKFHVHITVAYSVKALDFGLMGHGWKSCSGFTCCHINAVLVGANAEEEYLWKFQNPIVNMYMFTCI